jgi:hypothetical protein
LNDLSNGGLSDQMFGPGGRTMLIYLKDTDNILYKTIGAISIKYYSKRNSGSFYDIINNYYTLNRYQANIGTTVSRYENLTSALNTDVIYMNSILGTYICNVQ